MRFRMMASALTTAMLLGLIPLGSAVATTAPTSPLQKPAQQQTDLLLKFYQGQNVSPPKCGQGQGSGGVDGVFLLPVLSFAPGDRTLDCKTNARSVLVDLGGIVITEDNRFPQSSWTLDGQQVPFTPTNLEPICDDIIETGLFGVLGYPAPATLDRETSITGMLLNSGVFTARVNRNAQTPDGTDLYADSVALGHPGQLATVFCGYKARIDLSPGTHTIVVDYSRLFPDAPPRTTTVFTYNITVKH